MATNEGLPESLRPLQLLVHDEPAEGLREEEVEDGEGPEVGEAEVHLQRGPAQRVQLAGHQATQRLTCTSLSQRQCWYSYERISRLIGS